jgi:hypothetical protein
MGYTTKFKGELTFGIPLRFEQHIKLEKILGEDVREHPEWGVSKDSYMSYVDLEITKGLTGLQWDGSEKTYEMPELIALVIRLMQEDFPEFSLSGKFAAQGEEIGDYYEIIVNKNKISIESPL